MFQALHQGASVLNCMLDVIQPCFMQPDVKILSKSYGAWRALIDNFAADPNWTQKTVDKSKQIKLVLSFVLLKHYELSMIVLFSVFMLIFI